MFEKFKLELVLCLAGLFLIGSGVFLLKSDSSPSEKVEIIEQDAASLGEVGVDFVVNISGAVVKPGMYSASAGSRLGEVIDLAGGLSADADSEWVEKNVNLAEKIKDGQKIYIPRFSEKTNRVSDATQSNEVNINTASATELEKLNGVGPATSKKIIENRPYSRVEELVERKVVSEKVYVEIKSELTLW